MSFNFGAKIAIAICLVIVALAIIANQPLLPPDRAPAAGTQRQNETIVGAWANESRSAYTLMEYRPDKTLKALVQPKTLYGRMFIGRRSLSGKWDQSDAAHVRITFTGDGGGNTTSHEIRFNGPNSFTDIQTGQTWSRVDKSL